MNLILDAARLERLCDNLNALSGARISVLGWDGAPLCAGGANTPFCERMRACPQGRRRCQACELRAIDEGGGAIFRRCHAGLRGAILPILGGERAQPLAWLCAGQFLDGESAREPRDPTSASLPTAGQPSASLASESQWESVRAGLGWFSGDTSKLREDFLRLRALSSGEQIALAGMMEAVADSIRLRGLIQPAVESDLDRLDRFLDAHYMEKLSLGGVSAQLRIGRTRLCALAKELSGGETLFTIVAKKRIAAAKALLIETSNPISTVAESVGISDYNYFSKIFRANVGVSPSEFRKRARAGLDPQE